MAKLYFLGIKHSGKTTQAKLAASILNKEAVDADDLVLSYLGVDSIRDFYRENGKDAFMKAEREAVGKYIASHDDFIMSLGGGASDNRALMEELKKSGSLIYLRREESEMLPVILKHGIPAFLAPENLESSFHDVYARRDRAYRNDADLTIDLGHYRDKEETARFLVSELKENGYV